jgi:ABC-type sugar transport system ATPase subunit
MSEVILHVKGLILEAGEFLLDIRDLSINRAEYFIVMGHTGAGKSLLIKSIAGLIVPDKGSIFMNGKDITNTEPRFRNVGYVPQDSALFPHLTVQENLEFPLYIKKMKKSELDKEVHDIADSLGITALLSRRTQNLSGGEKQKVALARALISRPDILLLDEPVSALDTKNKEEICGVLQKVHSDFNITALHVCHDRSEAHLLGDRAGILRKGNLAETGKPIELFSETNFIDVIGG